LLFQVGELEIKGTEQPDWTTLPRCGNQIPSCTNGSLLNGAKASSRYLSQLKEYCTCYYMHPVEHKIPAPAETPRTTSKNQNSPLTALSKAISLPLCTRHCSLPAISGVGENAKAMAVGVEETGKLVGCAAQDGGQGWAALVHAFHNNAAGLDGCVIRTCQRGVRAYGAFALGPR
jgi:hypothetical protein